MTVGSALWGEIASLEGLPFALNAAAVGAAIGLVLTLRWKLETGAALDLAPSMHWRAPAFVQKLDDDVGPILVVNQYRINPNDAPGFLEVMQEIGRERMRDGAYAWNLFYDPDDRGLLIETWLAHSLLELEYRAERETKADELMERRAQGFLEAPAKASYFIAAERPPAIPKVPRSTILIRFFGRRGGGAGW